VPAADADAELPGLDPLSAGDDPPGGSTLPGDAFADLQAFDDAGDADGDPFDDADSDDDSPPPFLVQFDEVTGLDQLGGGNGAWTGAAVTATLAAVLGAGAVRRRLRHRRDAEPLVADVVEMLEDSGIGARVEYGSLVDLERALAAGDQIVIRQVVAPAAAGAWEEQPLAIRALDRTTQQVLLGPAVAAGSSPGASDLPPTLQLPLGVFIDAWADSVGEIVVVEASAGAPRALLLPISIPERLLRPVERTA
jgi:hypothetical protein